MSATPEKKIGRRTFVSGTVLATAALAACRPGHAGGEAAGPRSEFYKVLSPDEYDERAMMAVLTIDHPHKQVFSASEFLVQNGPNYGVLFAHMQFAMNGYDFSLGGKRGPLATLGVMSGLATLLALNDAVWTKYEIGRIFDAPSTNVYWPAKSALDPSVSPNDPNGLYQDLSAEAVRKRGGAFMVCHNALTKVAMRCASKNGNDGKAVLSDFMDNLQPGCLLVPSGVTAVQLAQEYGWKLYTVA